MQPTKKVENKPALVVIHQKVFLQLKWMTLIISKQTGSFKWFLLQLLQQL